ncbi:tetratricopeptide repeat protein [Devosia sp. Root436]|uniref:tetratricopeptide repeat protein n=1 Tax=Devosia sp. Root436 TaxID=1736537 RepID=UPI0012E37C6C|nr:tetratricopeptide repeat protein [Devosia sp. Root436]
MPSRLRQGASQLPPTANPVQALEAGIVLNRTQKLWDEGKIPEALHACNDILKTDPNHAGALYMMGMLALELGALDMAIGSLERAAASSPGTTRILVGLGQAFAKSGQPVKAAGVYTKALQLSPNSGAAYRGLGLVQLDLDQRGNALKSFRKALKINPDDQFATYMLAALADAAPVAPEGYVPALFDSYAEQFDLHLTGKLGYRIPEEIAELVGTRYAGDAIASAVDLGCGTGLVGAALGARVAAIDGVDLSPRMLAKAADRGIYRTLREGDATDILNRDAGFAGPYDLATAADVFIYIGRLEAAFAAVKARLAPKGLFAFSVEVADQGEVDIRSSGRFVHSHAYIAGLAEAFDFSIVEQKALIIRQEIDVPVPGTLYLLRSR